MIIESSRKATCKDCDYCRYFYPMKKDGTESNVKRHKCVLTGKIVFLSNRVCDKWKMGYGFTYPINYDDIDKP